jgi:broad specificity phosphatase PhoE
VILIRHAMPERVPGVPPREWHLGEEGRAAARTLAALLPSGARIVSSDEPKAVETAEQLGGTVTVDPRLREVGRPSAWDDGYRDTARRYIAGERLAGWETHDDVVERFRSAATGDIVVTHGMAMTLYLSEGVRFWEALTFPDAWSALAGELRRVH